MKHAKLISYAVFVIIISSCAIKGSLKGLYSYYDKTKSENPNLFLKDVNPNSLCYYSNENVNSKVFVTNGLKLKKCISQNSNTLIYIWSPQCKAPSCLPLDVVQNFCDTRNIDLFIVAQYYDSEQMTVSYTIKRPIFGIDTEYYKTNLTKKYLSLFLKDLNANATDERYLYFKNGVFLKSFNSLNDF